MYRRGERQINPLILGLWANYFQTETAHLNPTANKSPCLSNLIPAVNAVKPTAQPVMAAYVIGAAAKTKPPTPNRPRLGAYVICNLLRRLRVRVAGCFSGWSWTKLFSPHPQKKTMTYGDPSPAADTKTHGICSVCLKQNVELVDGYVCLECYYKLGESNW